MKDSLLEREDKLTAIQKTISNTISSYLRRGGIAQNNLAAYLRVDPSTVHNLLDGDTRYTAYHLSCIAKFFGISIDELFTGIAPENVEAHDKTGLKNESINWLTVNRKENEHRLDMVDVILENKEIADALFDLIYAYSTSFVPSARIKSNGDIDVKFATLLANNDLLLGYALNSCVGDVLKLIKEMYKKNKDSYAARNQEHDIIALFERVGRRMEAVSNKMAQLDAEEQEDLRRFEVESKDYE